MVKRVEGYKSSDGLFFDTIHEAVLHEADMALRAACLILPNPVNADRFIPAIEALADQTLEYLNAYKKVNPATEVTAEPNRDTTDNGQGSTNDHAMEQFTLSGHEPMPDVGSSTSSEEIRERRTKHGARSRRDDA